jgi:DNA polymerase-3 subunit delta'
METRTDNGEPELRIDGRPFYGQHQARNLLSRTLGADRLAHAYLFYGPEGIGKKLLARGLAMALSCKQRDGLVSCGQCRPCKKFAAASHPDFLALSPEKGAIKIAQVRELIKKLTFAPYEAEYRVVVVEDVHTMGLEAANALLKTLEEPPPNNIIILSADSTSRVLKTIISRCQTIPFYALTPSETATVLRTADESLDQKTALLLARLAEGSPGRAQLLLQRNLVSFWGELQEMLLTRHEHVAVEVSEVLLMASAMAALKSDLLPLFSLIRLWIRDCLFALDGQQDGDADLRTRKDWNSDQYFAKLGAVNQAEKELGRNCNRTLVCEVLLFRLKSE